MCIRTEEEIAERELIRACFHEVSHGVIADQFGVFAEAFVWRNEDHEASGETAWLGRCQMMDYHNKLTVHSRRMIGMAGFLAEEIALAKNDGEHENMYLNDTVVKFFDPCYFDSLSVTDRRGIGSGFDEHEVEQAVRLVLGNWNKIDALANELKQLVLASDSSGEKFASLITANLNRNEFFGTVLSDGR